MIMASLRLSVALCTYNGSAHLAEQLDSLARQTRPPDELVVFDDASTDRTLEILNRFAAARPGFPVTIRVNPQTLGPTKNFEQAIAACNGDVILLCDQDDGWREDKTSLIQDTFLNQPDLGFVFSDAQVCDQSGQPLGYRLWDSVRFCPRLRRKMQNGHGFEVLLRQNVVTGATLAFSARFRPMLLPIDPRWIHDGWIALLLSVFAPIAQIPEPVIQYRQHPQQAIGALQRTLYQEYLAAKAMDPNVFAEQAQMFEAVLARLSQLNAPNPVLRFLEKKIQHCRRRSAIRRRESSRLPAFAEFLTLRYRHFSLGWKSFAQDLFL
jgi:glycosyltransferase involved in cell wall biosynthesis